MRFWLRVFPSAPLALDNIVEYGIVEYGIVEYGIVEYGSLNVESLNTTDDPDKVDNAFVHDGVDLRSWNET